MSSQAEFSRQLRALCAKCKNGGVEELRAFLETVPEHEKQAVVSAGNNNGKAPLHFVAQFWDCFDGVPASELLIECKADVNAMTVRGHTPLIFAAGRGHNGTVGTLLDAGANARVLMANGQTARSFGKRLEEAVVERLRQAEEGGEWIDLRDNEDAIAAQKEHEEGCIDCREKRGDSADVLAALLQADAAPFTLLFARDKIGGRAVMRAALRSREGGLAVLRAFRKEVLGRQSRGVLGTLLSELRCVGLSDDNELDARPRAALCDLSAAEVREASELPLAMEICALLDLPDKDKTVVEEMLDAAIQRATADGRFCPDVAFVGGMRHERGMNDDVRCWIWLLRWAMQVADFLDDPVGKILEHAPMLPRAVVPEELVDRVRLVAPDAGQRKAAAASKCPVYSTSSKIHWVDSEDDLLAMEKELQKAVVVGLDAEWGQGDIATLQLGIEGVAWVVDAACVGFADFLRRFFACQQLRLGFGFKSDTTRLLRVMGDDAPPLVVEDVQPLAAKVMGRTSPPSLAHVAETFLGRTIDKRLQCSNWDMRPLSADQVAYAATDALVLLDISHALSKAAFASPPDAALAA
eukprot:TRINITY_DN50852_c0_g1_i1.p1 TRINITY_DN50852_c0_g1~~TRINITY_DN50852_c0_g1_i1.p1  ORF type:complete len:580 (+),score=176.86 TRINITY_DN50852_c0_g1_i1:115-1854(+)